MEAEASTAKPSSKRRSRRPWIIGGRWGYALAVALISAIAFVAIFASADLFGAWTYPIASKLAWWIQLSVRQLLAAVIAWTFLRLCPIHWGQLWSLLRYPSTWAAIAVGYLAACGIAATDWMGPSDYRPEWYELIGLGVTGVVVAEVFRFLTSPPSSENNDLLCKKLIIKTWEELKLWIESGEKAAEDDILNRLGIAKRFADRLRGPFGEDKLLGLIGPYGAGKSSVIHWLKAELKTSNVWFCEVSCWGFDDSSSAIKHILSAALATVSKHADSFSLRNLPDVYRKALSAGAAWWPSMADLFVGQTDPFEVLNGFSPMLEALNARLVIVVEDLDRNQSARFDASDVTATLQRLGRVKGVSYVITGGQPSVSRIDFAKLCDHFESLPQLEGKFVIDMIVLLRRQCLSMIAINPNPPNDRTEKNLWGFYDYRDPGHSSGSRDKAPVIIAVARLLQTPRSLKHALRSTWQQWQSLCGEIDFDDLLVANVLRFGADSAFTFLARNADRLRWETTTPTHESDKKRALARHERLLKEWGAETERVEWDPGMALDLLRFLVPNSEAAFFGNDPYDEWVPQGIRHKSPTDYFRRLLAEELEAEEIRDQDVLRDLAEWNENHDPKGILVVRLCQSREYGAAWRHFVSGIRRDRRDKTILKLADAVIVEALRLHGASTASDSPGIDVVGKEVRGMVPDQDNASWLIGQIRRAMPISLSLARSLSHQWTNPIQGLVLMESIWPIRTAEVDSAQEVYSTGEKLLAAIGPEPPYIVRWLVLPPHREVVPQGEPSFDWKWLGPVLLAAAKLQPVTMWRQIAHLVGDHHSTEDGLRAELNRPRLDAVFGDQKMSLLEFLKDEKNAEGEEAYLKNLCGEAEQYLTTLQVEAQSAAESP